MRKNTKLILFALFLIAFCNQLLIAQDADSLSSNESSQSHEENNDTNSPNQKAKNNQVDGSFTTYYSSRTTQLNSIGVGIGDQFNLWYYYLTPLTGLERIKYISFGFGFGGTGADYVAYTEDGLLIDNNDNSYFFFLGGSIGFTFFITERMFLHSTIGAEFWIGDTHSGSNFTYEYEEGFLRAGAIKPMTSIGLFSVVPISKYSTTSIGLAFNYNGFQDKSYSIIFTFY